MEPRLYLFLASSFLLLETTSGQAKRGVSKCAHLRYGSYCLGQCRCNPSGTTSCDRRTGRCRCKQGYSGVQCSRDFDECSAPGSDWLCPYKFQYCKNVFGSFHCTCQSGYRQRKKNGRCHPCSGNEVGRGCKKQCDCLDANTISCSTDIGTCVCKLGWEGVYCERSVDDCIGNPCGDQPCGDKHRGYSCNCPHGQFYVGNKCKNFHVGMMTINPTPKLGDRVEVYVFYSLPSDYYINPDRLPNVDHQLFINDKSFCRMSFLDFNHRVTGRENFVQKYYKKHGSAHTINFYSIYLIPLMEPKLITLRAEPVHSDFNEMSIVVDVRERIPLMGACFKNLRIHNLTRCLRLDPFCTDPGNVPNYKRHDYHQFQAVRDDVQNCPETPRYLWVYYIIKNVTLQADTCPNSDYIIKQNVHDLEARSGEQAITDHFSEVEILPANFLPLGKVEICVVGYLSRDTKYASVACGSINVLASYKIKGKLIPPATYLYVDVTENFILHADYKELDLDSPLTFTWLYKATTTPGAIWKPLPISGKSDEAKVSVQSSAITPKATKPGEVVIHIRVKVALKFNPGRTNSVTNNIQVELLRWEWGVHFYSPVCLGACDHVVGAGRNVGVSPNYDARNTIEHKKINRTFTIEENSQDVGPQRYQKMTGLSPQASYVKTKANSLKPGLTYKIIYTDYYNTTRTLKGQVQWNITRGYMEYEFEVEPPPIGNGCTMAPSSGKAIFTPFNFECLDYVDTVAGLPVVYHLVQKEHVVAHTEEFFTLIAYGGYPTLTNISLSSEEVGTTTTVHLKMRVINVKGSAAEVNFTVQLEVDDQKAIVEKVLKSSILQRARNPRQENVRSVSNVATILTKKATASKDNKVLVRDSLLSNLENFDSRTAESVEHTSHALEKSCSKEDEIGTGGLSSGLTAGEQLTFNVGKVSNENVEKVRQVATLLTFAVSRLIYVATALGNSAVKGKLSGSSKKNTLIRQNKDQSKKGVQSMDNVQGVLARNIKGSHQILDVKTDHVDIGVELQSTAEENSFELGRQNLASFSLPTADTGLLDDEEVQGAYQVYDKNPYAFATENIHGDLPVIKVGFERKKKPKTGVQDVKAEPEIEASTVAKPITFRFSKPGDVFLDFNGNSTEELEYPLVVDVEKVKGQDVVVKSSCILMAVPASADEDTVLDVRSRDGLKMKVHMGYTNTRRPFSEISEERTMEIPFEIESTINTSRGVLSRDPNLIFFPKLNKQRQRKAVPFYKVSISIKLRQPVNVSDLELADHQGGIRGSDSNLGSVTAYNTTVTVIPYVMACKHFDGALASFLSDKCWLTMFSNTSLLHCKCAVAGAYTGSYLVKPRLVNPFDFSLFLKFFDNPMAISLVIAIWLIFAASFIWGKMKDDRDREACIATILEDNLDSHTYVYVLCVSTGWSIRAATSSRVYVYIVGSWDQSETHLLHDSSKRLFESGAQNWFILTTDDDLGEIRSVVVWTDFSGGHPSWFLNSIFIQNLQTSEAWTCEYNGWLSILFGGQQLMAEVPAVRDEVSSLDLAWQLRAKAKADMRNDHLWIGMFAKTAFNKFTRVKRLITAITILQCLMLINIMFFGVQDADDPGQFTVVMGQTIHLTSVIISIQSSVITSILGLILAFVLQMVRPIPVMERVDVLTEQQQSMMQRHEEMKARKQIGLARFFPETKPSIGDVDFIGIVAGVERDRSTVKDSSSSDSSSSSSESSDDVDSTSARNLAPITGMLVSDDKKNRSKNANSARSTDLSGNANSFKKNDKDWRAKLKETDVEHADKRHTLLPLLRRKSGRYYPRVSANDPRRKSEVVSRKSRHVDEQQMQYKRAEAGQRESETSRHDDPQTETLQSKSEGETDLEGNDEDLEEDLEDDAGQNATSQEKADEEEEERQDSFMLPWWSIYVTYTMLFLLNLALAYYIMLYGLSLGYDKSLEWFLAFFSGFFVNVFFMMPAKVLAMATILVVFFEHRITMRDQSPLKKLAEGIKLLEKEREVKKSAYGFFRKRRHVPPQPLSTAEAKQVLERLQVEKQAKVMLRDLFLYTLFTITVLVSISGHVQVRSQYLQQANVEVELLGLTGSTIEGSDEEVLLNKAGTVDALWRYLIDDVTPRLVPEVDLITSHLKRSYFLVTQARLRQVRIRVTNATDHCLQKIPRVVWPRDNTHACIGSLWGDEPEETRHFNGSWNKLYGLNGSDLDDSAHRYWGQNELSTPVFVGQHGIYSGGGYVKTFYREDTEAVQNALEKLRHDGWVDRLTRCLFLEFTVYNPSANMYTQVVIAFEVDRYGAVLPTKTIHTAILSPQHRDNSAWFKMAEAVAAICVLFYMYRGVHEILHTSLGMFFSNLWNWLEFLVSLVSLLCVIFYMIRLATYLNISKSFDTFGHSYFLDFTRVFHWQEVFHANLGIFGALVIFKLVKVTSFIPFNKKFFKTMIIGKKDFTGHIMCTFVIILAFACLGMLVFGAHSLSYSTLGRALIKLLFFILGEPDYPIFVSINEYIGRFFFLSFLIITQYFLINFFIAILRDSLELSRYTPYTKEIAILRYMIDATMMYFNLTARNKQQRGVKSPFAK